MGDQSAAEGRIYKEREDARTIAGGLRKETTPRHERFDGATSIWTEWFNSYNANVLVPYALAKAPPRPTLRADGAGSSEGESTGPECVLSPADSLQLLQEYVEINAVTMPVIDQWQKDTQRYQQQTLRFDRAPGRIRVSSREDADAFHKFRYRRYVELFDTKFNEAPKMRTSPSMLTSIRKRTSLFYNCLEHRCRQLVGDYGSTAPALKNRSARPCTSTTPLEAVAAVEAAEAQAEVSVVVMAVDAAMEAHPEADEDRARTLATSSTMADLEAMFARILEKSQAAHGAAGAMRLAVEVPDPFLDCVNTDDHGTLLHGASCVELPMLEPQASIHPVDVVQHGVKPLESRRRLSATSSELQQIREVQRSAYPDYPEYDRHSAFYVDCKLTVIVIGGVRILMALLDTGCEYSGVHRRVVDRMKPGEMDATLQSMCMQGIGGKREMQRLVGRISYVINLDTDWERKFEWPSFAILEGDHLPDVVFRTELQPDNVRADAAVQPQQQDDEASEAELPELVADSDDEEDFVPCWEEDVADHVANAIASCFTLRASPMDADHGGDEELPGLMEDSIDDDDVNEELTIITQTEPEVEAALDSEPLAAGACYAMRAEDPSADNLQEPDRPSDDEELEDGTVMPLRHEDEIPDWRELRRQRQAAGRLHLSGHTLQRLC
eukprot:jgi/Tetstr1/463649/TSEL_008510.t1